MISDYERALSALNILDAGCCHEEWVRIGMAAKDAGINFDDFNHWSSKACNYVSEKDCATMWNSVKNIGKITKATLFYKALQEGWCDPNKPDYQSSNSGLPKYKKSIFNERAQSIWNECIPADDSHGYIKMKGGDADGLRIYPATASQLKIAGQDMQGYLVVPCYSDGKIQTLQFISPCGKNKLNLDGCPFNDGYFTVGNIVKKAYICEGIGHSWATYQASGIAAIVCFSVSRMKVVAQALRNKCPEIELTIVPDRGKEEIAAKIARAIKGNWVELPRDKPENYDVNDYAKEHGYDVLAELLCTAKTPEMRYKLLSGDELINMPSMRWIIRGVLPAEGLAALYGPSMSGKSFLAIDMACAIATGEEFWFGYRVTKVPVTYVCLEGEAGLRKRLNAWSKHYKKPIPKDLKFVIQPFNLLSDDINALADAIESINGQNGLVIIDTLNRAALGIDENSSTDMGRMVLGCEKLKGIIGGLVELVHHTGKSDGKGPRGHSSLFAALDAAIETTKIEDTREWKIAKSKDDESGMSHAFNLEIISLENDEESEEITSCVVAPCDNVNKSGRYMKTPSSGNQKIIWKALGNLFKISKYYGQGGAHAMKACVQYNTAVEETMIALPCPNGRQKERAKAAITSLVANGLLGCADGWLWVP